MLWPTPRTFFPALFAVVGASLLGPSRARGDEAVLPAGLEQRLLALPGSAPYPGGLLLGQVNVERQAVRYHFTRGAETLDLELVHPSPSPAPSPSQPGSEQTPHFKVTATGTIAAPELARLRGELVERIRAHDTVDVWDYHRTPKRPLLSPPQLALGWYAALAICGLLVLGLALAGRLAPGQAIALVAALGSLALVVRWGWVSDDAHITFRYARNLLDGQGLVFNRGERVQGYTHPLWLLLLVPGMALLHPYLWALTLGFVFSSLLLLTLWKLREPLGLDAPAFVLLLAAIYGCDSFLAFSTSGLENSLTHALVGAAILASARIADRGPTRARASAVVVLAALAALCRLDSVLLTAPLCLGLVLRERTPLLRHARPGILVAASLLVGWFGFATLYYGYPLPNTWYAKTGVDPLAVSIGSGLRYLWDTALHEPLPSLLAATGIAAGWSWLLPSRRPTGLRAAGILSWLAVGATLQTAYVIAIGGDYMRGRFLVAPLWIGALLAVAAGSASKHWRALGPAVSPIAAVASLALLFFGSHADAGAIVDERRYHPEASIGGLDLGAPTTLDTEAVRLLAARGPAVLSTTLVAKTFVDDPALSWIDGYGLTDAFVARCPAPSGQRAGHILRIVPRAYLETRADARLLPDGEARLRRGDPALYDQLAALRSRSHWPTAELQRSFEELQLLTRGALLDPQRLRLLPRYFFARNAIAPVNAAEAVSAEYF